MTPPHGPQHQAISDVFEQPVLIVPANVTRECGSTTAPGDTGMATATDGCGSASVTFSDSVSYPCPGSQIITRTWTATDLCGNTSVGTQIITLSDTTAPVLTIPPSVTLDCPADTSTNANARMNSRRIVVTSDVAAENSVAGDRRRQ